MPEQTQAETPVSQAPDIEAALESSFGFSEPPKKVPEPQQEVQQESLADPDSDEVTPDDLPEIEAEPATQSVEDAFEIVHNGAQVKLSREEAIKYARQGFDYTQKTQALAEQARQLQAQTQRVQELEQMQQALAPELAQVQAVAAQLKQWQNVDWVQLAGDNPLEYPKYRAQYDTLVQAHQVAMQQFQHKAGAIQQHKQVVAAQNVQAQRAKLLEMMPTWSDPAKYEQGAQEVRAYLQKQGVDEQSISQITDARGVVLAWKAAQYDKLLSAKADKVKQLRTAPPVVKPGAVSQQNDGKTEFRKFRQDFRKAGQTGNSRAQEGLLEQRLARAFKM